MFRYPQFRNTELKETYSDFQSEMDLINQAFADVMMEGDARGRPFTFPIPTYNITASFDWYNPNLETVWKMTGKYGTPYFSNFVNSDLSPEDVRSMCCRLRLDNRELLKRGGGLFGANPLTGSIGVVTINLPRIGYLSEDENDFFERLRKMVSLTKESLSIKRRMLERSIQEKLSELEKNPGLNKEIIEQEKAMLSTLQQEIRRIERVTFYAQFGE
jgi:anaerobic ribonucleoside-triphosphate reductase